MIENQAAEGVNAPIPEEGETLVKMVDLSTDVAGQWAAKLLAMGRADVERPARAGHPDALARYLDGYKQVVEWTGPGILDGADVVFSAFDAGGRTGFAADVSLPDQYVEVMTSTFERVDPTRYSGAGRWPLGPRADTWR